jgi:hypothetical protein
MDPNFNPDDINEMSSMFANIMSDSDQGYVMEFSISRLQAKDLMTMWTKACLGDPVSTAQCLVEYGKIMMELQYALKTDERNKN